jgi:hypothetical protein
VFCFELFLSGVDLEIGGAMASSSDDKEKTPPEDDTKDFWLKEEVESEDEEEDQSSRPIHPSLMEDLCLGSMTMMKIHRHRQRSNSSLV